MGDTLPLEMFTKKYSDLLLKEKIFRLDVQLSLRSKTGRFTHTCWIQQIISIHIELFWFLICAAALSLFYTILHIWSISNLSLSFIMADGCIHVFLMLYGKTTQTAYVPPWWGHLNMVLKESWLQLEAAPVDIRMLLFYSIHFTKKSLNNVRCWFSA